MSRHHSLALGDEQVQRAVLRDRVLACARLLGWPAHTAIAFTEQVTHHPWKRCGRAELAAILDQLHGLRGDAETDRRPARFSQVRSADRRTVESETERKRTHVDHD